MTHFSVRQRNSSWLHLGALLLGSLGAAATASGQLPLPGQGSSVPQNEQPRKAEFGRPIFEFHSGFWINLHHFLYEQARLSTGASADSRQSVDWSAALHYYATEMSSRDLLFDSRMVLINNRLAQMEPCPDLSGTSSPTCASGLRPELIATLERAAPVYRARWWPQQDRANRAWIAAVAPMVLQMGLPLARQLSRVYHSDWPGDPIPVDVTAYGGPFGAYTSLDPIHITVSSADSRNQGLAAFEILFHEASHALAGGVEDAIVRDCRAREIPVPRDLWHALLFYTTGEMVKRALDQQSHAAPSPEKQYEPYAYRNGLYERGWQGYERVLRAYWQPYLDGKVGFDRAVDQMVASL
ncbi:MAG: hypothetical protein ACRD50_07235 [Candidatus Acidiferrales bacterium]